MVSKKQSIIWGLGTSVKIFHSVVSRIFQPGLIGWDFGSWMTEIKKMKKKLQVLASVLCHCITCKLKFFFYLHHHSPLNSLNIIQQFPTPTYASPRPQPRGKVLMCWKTNLRDNKWQQREAAGETETERRKKEKRAIEEAVGVTKDVSRENRTLVSHDHTL